MESVDQAVWRNRRLIQSTQTTVCRDVVAQLQPARRLQVILGERGVGKSTALRQFTKKQLPLAEAAYLSLEDLVFDTDSLFAIGVYLYDSGIRYLLLDEVHRYPNWSREIKLLYDSYPELKCTITGSSVAALTKGDFDLSRRAVRFEMPGLSWREFEKLTQGIILPKVGLDDLLSHPAELCNTVLDSVASPVARYKQYLRSGYYPYCLEEDIEALYLQRVRAAAMLSIDQDVVLTAGIKPETTHKLKRLLALIASNVPYKPNMTTLAQQLATDRKSSYRLLELLEQAKLIIRLWASGQTPKTLAKPEKIYLQNTNLAVALGGADLGTLRELAFLMSTTPAYTVTASKYADFDIDGHTFEVGGAGKSRRQLKGVERGYRVLDNVALGGADRLPLYLFGLLY